jgi:hypothetical protein
VDPARLALTFAVLAIGVLMGRLVLGTVGRTGDLLSSLFVPPDRALGWPRGVQESDEPWGWRGAAPGGEPDSAGSPGGGEPREIRELRLDRAAGPFVVPVRRVRRR